MYSNLSIIIMSFKYSTEAHKWTTDVQLVEQHILNQTVFWTYLDLWGMQVHGNNVISSRHR